jgi:hypothetical protein
MTNPGKNENILFAIFVSENPAAAVQIIARFQGHNCQGGHRPTAAR